MKPIRNYVRRLNTPGVAPGVQSWALAIALGLMLGTAFNIDAIGARASGAAAYVLQLVATAPLWAYLVGGFVVTALLVIVPTVRAFRSAPLDVEDWSDSQLRTLRNLEAQQNVVRLSDRRAAQRRGA